MLHAIITDRDNKSRLHLLTGTITMAAGFATVVAMLHFLLI